MNPFGCLKGNTRVEISRLQLHANPGTGEEDPRAPEEAAGPDDLGAHELKVVERVRVRSGRGHLFLDEDLFVVRVCCSGVGCNILSGFKVT